MLRTHSGVCGGLYHVRPQPQHRDDVTPGAGRLSLNPKIPPYPRGSKPQTQRKLEHVPGPAVASSSSWPQIGRPAFAYELCKNSVIYYLLFPAGAGNA